MLKAPTGCASTAALDHDIGEPRGVKLVITRRTSYITAHVNAERLQKDKHVECELPKHFGRGAGEASSRLELSRTATVHVSTKTCREFAWRRA